MTPADNKPKCGRFQDDPDAPGCCIGCGDAREAHAPPPADAIAREALHNLGCFDFWASAAHKDAFQRHQTAIASALNAYESALRSLSAITQELSAARAEREAMREALVEISTMPLLADETARLIQRAWLEKRIASALAPKESGHG